MSILRLFLLSVLACSLASCATASKTAASGRTMSIRTTAYTANEPGGSYAANGTRLHYGGTSYSAAADWSWLPLGTRFRMKETGRVYTIEDYGSALVGKHTVDLFMPNNAAMHEWGVRNVNIEVLEWGSRAMSLKMLEPRQRAGYVHTMVASLKKPAVSTPVGPLLAQE